MHRIRLSEAQLSAIECRMDGDESVDGLTVDGRHLIVEDIDATFDALNDASNSEDAAAEGGHVTGDSAIRARRAARSLSALAGRVLNLHRKDRP